MTALGKTLVFFNLLFALVTGGLIVMVFLTRTNWKIGMDQAVMETKAAQAAQTAEQAKATQQKSELENAKKKLEEEIVELNKQIRGKDAEITNLKKQVNDSDRGSKEQLAVSEAASKEITRLQLERNQMADQLKNVNDNLAKISKELADMTARETYSRLRSDALEKELSATKEELASVKRKNEVLRAQLPPGADRGAEPNRRRAPSIDTSGRVTSASGNLAVVSLGSDNGIEQGHILQVYRTGANPVYLGTLTITRAEPHRSVGNFEPAGRGKEIAKDDIVDTKIIR